MKKAFLIIGIMLAAVMASAQSHNSHTIHWGDGTSTTVTTYGNHTYVHNHGPKPLCFFEVYTNDTVCGKIDIPYGLKKPEPETVYAVFISDVLNPNQDAREIGKLCITKECKGKMHGSCVIEFNEGCGPNDFDDSLKEVFMVKCSDSGYRIVSSMNNLTKRQKEKKMKREYGERYISDEYVLITHEDDIWNTFRGCLFWKKK
jgi:hypothetical protein